MTKAVVENGIVINIIEHTTGKLIMPEGQMYVPTNGQPVGIGMSYDYVTGAFDDTPGIPQRTETIENDLIETQLALAELAAIITEGGEA
jgi:hypothetical protein